MTRLYQTVFMPRVRWPNISVPWCSMMLHSCSPREDKVEVCSIWKQMQKCVDEFRLLQTGMGLTIGR